MSTENDFNSRVYAFGRDIFERIGKEQPGTFSKDFFQGKMMEWTMSQPELKINMFRLVDVLPTLKSSAAVAEHVNEYLGKIGGSISSLLDWGLNVDPHSIRAKLTSYAVRKSVEQMASQFIAGETPKEALKKLKTLRRDKICFTVDLLGEFCVSTPEAQAYLDRYLEALTVLSAEFKNAKESQPIIAGHPGESSPVCISVKLSALYSQTSVLNQKRSVAILSDKLGELVAKAREVGATIYVDAEDSGNNIIVYRTFKEVFGNLYKDFPYPGIVVQAYAKGSQQILEDLLAFSKQRGTPIAVRLVKGAYWDYETVISQQNHWESPLFKNKSSSDANYEALSRILIDNHQLALPALASHNVRSLAHACVYAEQKGLTPQQIELQMLFGMADPITKAFVSRGYLVRQYVPLGEMLPGMGYLVRRLLENTSNESFLRHTFFDHHQTDKLLEPPQMKD